MDDATRTSKRKTGIIAVIAIFIFATVAITAFVVFSGGRSYEETVEMYVDYTYNRDTDSASILKLCPDGIVDYILEKTGYTRDEFCDKLREAKVEWDEYLDEYYGQNWKLASADWLVEDFTNDSTESITGMNLQELQEKYQELGINVSEAKKVITYSTFERADGAEAKPYPKINMILIKVGNSWCLGLECFESYIS